MNNDTATALQRAGCTRVETLPQICFSEERLKEFDDLSPPPTLPPIRLLSIGRLVYWKGFQYGIMAAALLHKRGVAFDYRIVGWGPYESELQSQIANLQLQNHVCLTGRMSNEQVIHEELRNSHVLIHPALHESFGNVCLEALAAGRPVICLNLGGPASQVTKECGFSVSISNPEEAAEEIADAICLLTNDQELLQQMSNAAKKRAQSAFGTSRLRLAVDIAYHQITDTES